MNKYIQSKVRTSKRYIRSIVKYMMETSTDNQYQTTHIKYRITCTKRFCAFFIKFNLYTKTNKKILISEIFPVCINDLLPFFGLQIP